MVSSLRPGRRTRADAASSSGVLPRPLRLMWRYTTRFVETSEPMPAGRGSLYAIAFVCVAMLYGAQQGGQLRSFMSATGATLGMQIDGVEISGHSETSERDVLSALGVRPQSSLFGLDVTDARNSVIALPWVERASVRKVYPGRLEVDIEEKSPFAVWQQGDVLSVVEQDGTLIAKFEGMDYLSNRFSHLPQVVGEGAEKRAADFLPLAARYPELAGRVAVYIRVADRRWDVRLRNGLTVKLPANDVHAALDELASLQSRNAIFDREIEVVDLRLADRITIRLSESANEARREFVEARSKSIRTAEKDI